MHELLADTRVLLIEDDEDSGELLVDGLELLGATTRHVTTGERALDLVETWTPDALICDLILPGIDGIEAVHRIRERPASLAIPAIALTGMALPIDRTRTLGAGFEKHLVKPTALGDIATAVATVVSDVAVSPTGLAWFRQIVAQLGVRSPCRFTSVLRFGADGILVSMWTFDREQPNVDTCSTAIEIEASWCGLVHANHEPLVIEDARRDPRFTTHPSRDRMAAYLGVALLEDSASFVGTLCTYDPDPKVFSHALRLDFAEGVAQLAPVLSAWVAAQSRQASRRRASRTSPEVTSTA